MGYTTSLGYTPRYYISKDGDDITGSFSDRLLSIRFSSFYGGGDADTIDIELDDRDWAIALPSVGGSGTTLEVALGYDETGLNSCGTFAMEEVNLSFPPKSMSLRGNSVGLNTNIKAPIISLYENQSVSDIVKQLAIAGGVTPTVAAVFDAWKFSSLYQHTSSGHLIQDLERRFNGVAKFENGYLSFTQRGTGLTVSGSAYGSVTLEPDDISDCRVRLTNTASFSKVRVSWWDKIQCKQVWVESSVKGDPASTVPYQIDKPCGTPEEAQALADAQMNQLNRQGVTGSVTLSKGDARIRGGFKLAITGTRSGMDGEYTVSSAVHTFNKDGGITSTLEINTEDGVGAVDTGNS